MSELNSNYYINLDIHRIETTEVISMTQGDNGRSIVMTFSESGVPFDLSDVKKAIFTGTKSDGT
ncbi:MAG: hypothetical protein Q4B40_07460, partial [Clostridia bacterium]|nr:hypothetical protein [Clostridia bacterium]